MLDMEQLLNLKVGRYDLAMGEMRQLMDGLPISDLLFNRILCAYKLGLLRGQRQANNENRRKRQQAKA